MQIKTLDELNREFIFDMLYKSEDSKILEPDATKLNDDKAQQPKPADPPLVIRYHPDPSELFMELAPSAEKKPKKKILGMLTIVTVTLFYVTLLIVLLFSITSSKYSFFTVLTASMQDEIPKNSLILVKQTDTRDLEVGDNITFMRDRRISVTHKIIDIYEDYQDDGSRGFQTQGTNNLYPDNEIVNGENIVGRVVFSIPVLGAAVSWLGENIYIVFIAFGSCIVISLAFRITNGKKQALAEEMMA